MIKDKNIHFIYITIIVIITISLLKLLIDKDSIHSSTLDDLKRDSFNFHQIHDIVMEQTNSNNFPLKNTSQLIKDDGSSISISEIVNMKDKFVIRFNDIGCSSCIEYFKENVHILNDFIHNIGEKNAIVILNTNNPRILYVFKKQHNLSCEVYGLPLGSLSSIIEKKDTVVAYYFCILSTDLIIKDCFINIQDWPQRTDAYFESIKRKYCTPNEKNL